MNYCQLRELVYLTAISITIVIGCQRIEKTVEEKVTKYNSLKQNQNPEYLLVFRHHPTLIDNRDNRISDFALILKAIQSENVDCYTTGSLGSGDELYVAINSLPAWHRAINAIERDFKYYSLSETDQQGFGFVQEKDETEQ